MTCKSNISRAAMLALALMVGVFASQGRTYSVEDVPNVQVADSTRLVSNPDGILSAEAEARINQRLRQIRSTTTAEPVVVVVDDIEGGDIDDFATALFTRWGIGKKDKSNGVLILVAKDLRRAAIRTGYGVEGVLPDITTGKILRHKMFPRFKEGDYDGGVEAGVDAVYEVMTNPDAAEELLSAQNGYGHEEEEDDFLDFILKYLGVSLIVTLVMMGGVVYTRYRLAPKGPVAVYNRLEKMIPVFMGLVVFGIGVPILALWLLHRTMRRVRNSERACPNCGTMMHKLDEEADNAYLTPPQDAEERLDSVDYDVWECPNCHETDIIPFVNKNRAYTVCPCCQARADRLLTDRIVKQPTHRSAGVGMKLYRCDNCGHEHQKSYGIPKLQGTGTGAVIGGIGGRGFGGGGGGFGGGGFGGGMTGGGGASGGW